MVIFNFEKKLGRYSSLEVGEVKNRHFGVMHPRNLLYETMLAHIVSHRESTNSISNFVSFLNKGHYKRRGFSLCMNDAGKGPEKSRKTHETLETHNSGLMELINVFQAHFLTTNIEVLMVKSHLMS